MAFLTGNMLKIIAAISMTLDHAGLMLFPGVPLLRILGRLAFPIFAFMIAEGCRHTRSRKKYFLHLFTLAVICQAVYTLVDGSLYFSVLFTFSLSILTVYALDRWKLSRRGWDAALFLGAVGALWILNRLFTIDYGFWGCMMPVLAFMPAKTRYDTLPCRVGCMGLGVVALAVATGGTQYYSLLALPLLMCYSGRRGKWKMKYFFYLFYPLHLAALEGLWLLLR